MRTTDITTRDTDTLRARLGEAMSGFSTAQSWWNANQSKGTAQARLALHALAQAANEVQGYARALRESLAPKGDA